MTRIEVRGYSVMGWTKVLPGIPTPRLADAGGGEAYFVPFEDKCVCGGYRQGPQHSAPGGLTPAPWHPFEADPEAGVWFLHDKGYESPDGQYTRVRVVSVEEPYPGDL